MWRRRMRMRLFGAAGLAVFAAALAGGSVGAATAPGDEMRFDFTLSIGSTPIADYQDEFNTSAPAAGWSYLYNANGPLGNPANYVPLTASGGKYTAPS